MAFKCTRCGQENYRETIKGMEVTFDIFRRSDGDLVSHIVEYEPGGYTVHQECNVCGCTLLEHVPEPDETGP